MGYTTEFDGQFTITPPLAPAHHAYLTQFARTRRTRRDPSRAARRPDPLRDAVGLPLGPQGGYFVGAAGDFGQEDDAPDITDYNHPPQDQPGLWCDWVPSDDGSALVWDQGEKFYDYAAWLRYLITHFFAPWGYTLDGAVRWRGESFDDLGTLVVTRNVVSVAPGF